MTQIDSCVKSHKAELLSLEQAFEQIFESIRPLIGRETLNLKDSLNRIIAEDIKSENDIPPHRNSSMDGYAISSRDIPVSGTSYLTVVGTSWAGRPYLNNLSPGQCVRIFTGAAVPEGADTVIMQEDVRRQNDSVEIPNSIKAGENLRYPGDDVSKGQKIFSSGRRLRAEDLGILASIGRLSVPVFRKLCVAFFSTGDELRPLGRSLEFGEIYDSNRYTLYGLLSSLGIDLLDMGTIPDNSDEIKSALTEAAAESDVIITTGGASVGEADYLFEAINEVGQIKFWKIAIKPGKPLLFGNINDQVFFGLPGNPVSVAVTFHKIVSPILKVMMGEKHQSTLKIKARCGSILTKEAGRREFQRGFLERNEDGELIVKPFKSQGSHILTSVSQSNCFIVLPEESTGLEEGQYVDVELFATL